MKKNILYLSALVVLMLGFVGCKKESKGLTRITTYAELELLGDNPLLLAKGSEFVDPGALAFMGEQDVTDQIKVTGSVDPTTSGVYQLTYKVINPDGFEASASRTVVVADPNMPLEGLWVTDPASYRVNSGGAPVLYGAPFNIVILANVDGTYFIEDLLAGWYCQRAGYGSNYAMQADIALADDGTVSLIDSYVPGWGDSADALDGAVYDATAGTLTYKVTYAGTLDFYVTLIKQ